MPLRMAGKGIQLSFRYGGCNAGQNSWILFSSKAYHGAAWMDYKGGKYLKRHFGFSGYS